MIKILISFFLSTAFLAAQNEQALKPSEDNWAQNTKNTLFERRIQGKPLPSNSRSESSTRRRANSLTSRIVGGKDAKAQAYPWMAAITSANNSNLFTSQFCAGSLIHPRWILTAAHCVVDTTPGSIQVILGAHDLTDSTGVQRLEVDEIIIHPNFIETPFVTNFDIALLRLSAPAEAQYTPIPLVDDDSLEEIGTLARVIGWGNTSATSNQFPNILQEVDVPIVSLDNANAASSYNNQITRFMLPAGFVAGGQDSCQGDSGGPLMVPSPLNAGWSIAGIVSFGNGCAQANFFGIYTSVSTFRDFVLSHIYPNYLLWEKEQGIRGELRDPDEDQLDNLAEFAFNTQPQTPDTPVIEYNPEIISGVNRQAITIQTPLNTEEIDYALLHSTDLQSTSQQVLDLEELTTNTVPLSGVSNAITRTVVTPFSADEPRAFFQVKVSNSDLPTTGPRTLNSPGSANGHLTANDLVHPSFSDRYQKLFSLPSLTAGEPTTISGRSSQFDTRLELLNAATLEVLQIADSNNAQGLNGEDEFLTFTPDPTLDYLIRLTSSQNSQTGSFSLGCFLPSSLPLITETSNLNAVLQSTDSTDPTREPHQVFIDQFHLADHSFDSVQIQLTSSFDSTLSVMERETGKNIAHADQLSGAPNNTEVLNFQPIDGQDYLIQVSSFAPNQTGNYQLELLETVPVISEPITTSEILIGSLDLSDSSAGFVAGAFFDDYSITDAVAGQQIRIDLGSNTFNTVIELLDDDTGQLITFSDTTTPSMLSTLTFIVQPGTSYRIRATSLAAGETGSYILETSILP